MKMGGARQTPPYMKRGKMNEKPRFFGCLSENAKDFKIVK